MSQINTANVQRYVQDRQEKGAANSTINRELAALKRMFVLAIKAEKLLYRPHIPMLQEHNVRQDSSSASSSSHCVDTSRPSSGGS